MFIQKRKIVLKSECKNWLHVCVIALLALFVLTFFIAAASAEGGYTYITKWGSEGTGDGQFYYPVDVAVDSSGNVFVADTGNDRIQKFGEGFAPPPMSPASTPTTGTEVRPLMTYL